MQSINKYLALEGNIRILAIQTFISQIGMGMLYPIWQPYMLSTGMSVIELGLIQTVLNISTGMGLLTWGYLSDRYGRKPVIIASNVCRVISLVILVLSQQFIAMIGFAFFMGFTAMFMMGNPARNALIAESVDSTRRATALSTLMTVSQGISTIMASAGGYIALQMGYTPIFIVCIVTDIIGIEILIRYLEETHEPREAVKDRTPIIKQITSFLLPETETIHLYIIMIIQGFGYAVAYSLFYGAITDSFGYNTFQLGLMSTAFSLTWAASSIPMGKLGDRLGRKKSLLMSIFMAYVAVIGFIVFRSIEAFILLNAITAIDITFWLPTWTSLISESVSKEKRSSVMGKLDAYGRIGAIPAPWLGGYLYENYGFNAPLYVQLFTLALSVIFILRIRETVKASDGQRPRTHPP